VSASAKFKDRREAGKALLEQVRYLASQSPVVVALPRGGVPVGFEVARGLGAPLDIAIVRKVGAPMHRELGVGAIAENGQGFFDADTIRAMHIAPEPLHRVINEERRELERRRLSFRAAHPEVDVSGRPVILVDDGIATGVTAVAAARALRARGAAQVNLAVPVCPPSVAAGVRGEFDDFVCLRSPRTFRAVGDGYADFSPTPDREVRELLAASRNGSGDGSEIEFAARDRVVLHGTLSVPADARGLIVFVHGSGSSRKSPRNRAVASHLNAAGLATFLFDLLTEDEAAERANTFDIDLLARRLVDATAWVQELEGLSDLPIGYYGASTGAAAALVAAAGWGSRVRAIVSRGGRPDLAATALPAVFAPTLLIVGERDRQVLSLNREVAARLGGESQVALIPGAGHLFEEPGALETVADLTADWFTRHLGASFAHPGAAAGGMA
jgi:predicted phosphoribosyltransferase/dienelactone hydrolase